MMETDHKKNGLWKYTLNIPEEVYKPAEDTFLIAENLKVRTTDFILDMGTGCGILSLISASKAAHVIALDINPHAVKSAKLNAIVNNVANKIEVICGDLFSPLKENTFFDLVVFNAPYLPTEDEEIKYWIDHAWSGGKKGRELIERFITYVSSYLRTGGHLLLVQSTLSSVEETLLLLKVEGFNAKIIAERKVAFETITLIEAMKL